MTLIIEDGSNVSGAEAYADLSSCVAWSVDVWGKSLTGNDADKEAAMRRAVAFMDGLNWKGARANGRSQSLAWPRAGVMDAEGNDIAADEIPSEVIAAQHIFARAEFISPGALAPDVTLSGRKVLTGVNGITWQVQGAPNTVEAARPVVTMAMDKIKGLLVGGESGGAIYLERA